MERYRDFRPTVFDAKGFALDGRQDWFVAPVLQHRCSNCLERSNFTVALQQLGGESDVVEVHRFGHWGPGWFEIIIVHPSLEAHVQDIEDTLAQYPVLDESHFNELEYAEACETWNRMSIKNRMEVCRKFRVSLFAARRDEIPERVELDYLVE